MSEVVAPPEATPRETVRSAVLTAAATPQKLAALKKAAKDAVTAKKDKKTAEAIVDEMVAAGELHKHGTGDKAPYGKDKPVDPNDPEKVDAALLDAATTPQKLAKLVKAATKLTKADASFVEAQANALIANHHLHKHGKSEDAPYGKDKPFDPNDPETVKTALLDAATTPQQLAKLVKAAAKVTKADAHFVEAQANALIADQRLHQSGSGEKPLFGKDKLNDPDKVNAALLEAAATPQKLPTLVKAVAKGTKADAHFVEAQANALIANQHLHKHGKSESAPYGKDKPFDPNDPEKVNAALLEAAATPLPLAKLVAAAVTATKASKEFVTGQADHLIASGQLHKQSAAKNAPYGLEKFKPPHALETEPGKKAFTALVKAAQKVSDVVPGVPLDEVIQHLRAALAKEAEKASSLESTAQTAGDSTAETTHEHVVEGMTSE